MPLVPQLDLALNLAGSDTVFSQGSSIIVGSTLYITTSEGALAQRSRISGVEVWRKSASGPYRGGPAVADGQVVAGARDGRAVVFAQDASGSPQWHTFLGGAISTAPTVAVVAGEARIFFGTGRGTLLCLRASDGSTVWTFDTGGPIWGAPAINDAGTKVYVGSYDHRVYCLNASDGSFVWTTTPTAIPLGPIRSPISILGNQLYVPTLTGGLWALQDNGSSVMDIWHLALAGSHTGGAAVLVSSGGGAASIFVASVGGELFGIRDLGTVFWARSGLGRIDGGVVVADNIVFVGTEKKAILAFSAVDGQTLQEMPTHEAVNADPAVGQGMVGALDAAGHYVTYGNFLDAPQNLTAVVVGGSIVLTWSPEFVPPANLIPVSGYNVYRSTMPSSGFSRIAFVAGSGPGSVAASVYTDSSVAPFILYYYQLTALNQQPGTPAGLAESSFSNVASARISSIPANLTASLAFAPPLASPGQWVTVTLTVTNTGGSAANLVVPTLGIDAGMALLTATSGPIPPSVPVLPVGSRQIFTWSYSVNGAGTAEFTATVTGTDAQTGAPLRATAAKLITLMPAVLRTIMNLTALPFDGYVTLSWQLSGSGQPLAGINVYRQDSPTGPLVLTRTLSGTATAFEDWRVEDNRTYRYTLITVGSDGQESGISATVSVTPIVQDWPMYQRDTLHDASDPSVLVTPPFGEVWRVKLATDNGRGFSGYQGGLIVGGTVYVVSAGGDVLACNVVTGATVWMKTGYVNDGPQPVLHHGLLYVQHHGGLTVFRASDGAVAWSLPAAVAGIGQPASPIVYRGLLIGGVVLNGGFRVVAVDIDPSSNTYQQVRWTVPTGADKTSPAAANGVVYIGDTSGVIHARIAESGTFVWDSSVGSVQGGVSISLFVAPPVLVVSHLGVTSGLDLTTGQIVWNYPTGAVYTAPASTGATVYIASSGTQVFALNARSGSPVWVANTATPEMSGPLVTQRLVHVCTVSGEFASFDRETGLQGPALQLLNTAVGVATLSAGAGFVYVPIYDGQFIAVTSVPPAPVGLMVANAGANLLLTWTPSGANQHPLMGYQILRATTASETGSVLDIVIGGGVSRYVDAAVVEGPRYYYRIRAVDVRGVMGLLSNQASGSMNLLTLVTSLTALAGESVVALQWTVQPGDAGFQSLKVYRRSRATDPMLLVAAASATVMGFSDIEVDDGVTYTYVATAVNTLGQEGPQSMMATATPILLDWPMFQRDAARSATDPRQALLPPLGEIWRVNVPGTFGPYQTPLVVSGTVYITTSSAIRAVRADTGAQLWQTLLAQTLNTPAYHQGRLYITNADGLLVLNAADGTEDWSIGAFFGTGAEGSPLFYREWVYAPLMTFGQAFEMFAMPVTHGAGQLASIFQFTPLLSSPAGFLGYIEQFTAAGMYYGIRGRSFSPLGVEWLKGTGLFPIRSTPAISFATPLPRVLVTSDDGYINAVDSVTPVIKWRRNVGVLGSSPAVDGATVYVASQTSHFVFALNVTTGATVWMAATYTSTSTLITQGTPVVTGGQVHIQVSNGQVFTLNKLTGAVNDVLELGRTLSGGYMVAGANQLYLPIVGTGQLLAVGNVLPAPFMFAFVDEGIQQLTVSWTPFLPVPPNLAGFRVFRATTASFSTQTTVSIASATTYSYTDTTVTPGVRYYYRVANVDTRGVAGRLSTIVSGKAFFAPNLIALITVPSATALVCPGPAVQVRGTAKSGNFLNYTLEFNQGAGFTLVKTSTIPVTAGVLGTVTPTGSGMKSIRLSVFDATGQTSSTTITFSVPAQNLTADIVQPYDGAIFYAGFRCRSRLFMVRGTALGTNFVKYQLRARFASQPGVYFSVQDFFSPVSNNILGHVTLPGCERYVIEVWVYDACGRQQAKGVNVRLTNFTSPLLFSARGQNADEHRLPQDVAVDQEDFLWVVDTQNRRVQKYTAGGHYLFEFGEHTTGSATGGVFAEPVAAAVDSQNRLLVLDRLTGTIQRFDESGAFLGRVGAEEFNHPEGLAVDAKDNIYVADTLNRRVVVLDAEGQVIHVLGGRSGGSEMFQQPTGVSIDPDNGHILVTDQPRDRVLVLDITGAVLGEFGLHGSAGDQFNHPYEAVVGRNRNLFITDTDNNRTAWWTLFDNQADALLVLPPEGDSPFFKHPHGVALDREESRIYVADTGNNRIVGIPIKDVDDTRSPRAWISSPTLGRTLSEVIVVTGIAADAYFDSYTLDVGVGEAPSTFFPIATSVIAVWNDQLALWDTAGLSVGVYTLRLTVTDKSGNVTEARQTVIVRTGTAPLIVSAAAAPSTFSSEQSGPTILYRLTRNADVQAMAVNPQNNRSLWLSAPALAGGVGGLVGGNTLVWNGRDDQGRPVPAGQYLVIVRATVGGISDSRRVPVEAVRIDMLPGGSGLAGSNGPGGPRPGSTGSGSSVALTGGSPMSGPAASTSADPHDNGWHNGNNPNEFVIDHSDKSQGQGSNHH